MGLIERLLKELLADGEALLALLLAAGGVDFGDGQGDGPAQAEVEVLGEEDGEQQCPAFDGGRAAVGAQAVVAVQVDEGRHGDAAEPAEEAEGIEPGADGVGAPGRGALHFDADFDGVGAELDPVVDKEANRYQRPDDAEEREVAELQHHFAEVGGDIVDVEFGFGTDAGEEFLLFGQVVDGGGRFGASVLLRTLRLHLPELEEALSLKVGHDNFHGEVDDLSCDGEVDDLLAKTRGVDSEGTCRRCLKLLVAFGKWLDGQAEDVQVWDDECAEGNVDECGE